MKVKSRQNAPKLFVQTLPNSSAQCTSWGSRICLGCSRLSRRMEVQKTGPWMKLGHCKMGNYLNLLKFPGQTLSDSLIVLKTNIKKAERTRFWQTTWCSNPKPGFRTLRFRLRVLTGQLRVLYGLITCFCPGSEKHNLVLERKPDFEGCMAAKPVFFRDRSSNFCGFSIYKAGGNRE